MIILTVTPVELEMIVEVLGEAADSADEQSQDDAAMARRVRQLERLRLRLYDVQQSGSSRDRQPSSEMLITPEMLIAALEVGADRNARIKMEGSETGIHGWFDLAKAAEHLMRFGTLEPPPSGGVKERVGDGSG